MQQAGNEIIALEIYGKHGLSEKEIYGRYCTRIFLVTLQGSKTQQSNNDSNNMNT
jgi:hypothetical protein